jgi:putative nucleotidyltransferase with HDIG domain
VIIITLSSKDLLNKQVYELSFFENNYLELILSVINLKDSYIVKHQKRVKELAVKMAEKMKLHSYQIKAVKAAALLHDVGKLNIPNEILYKPGKLSKEEFEVIKKHSKLGSDLIRFKNEFIADIILQHHEKLNGTGYPRGLKGGEILLEAEIIAVADVVEAMASHRPYRPALGIEEALTEIKDKKGILYNEKISDICIDLFLKDDFKF